MNKSTPITSRIQKRSIGGIVQPAIEGMGSVAKMDNKILQKNGKGYLVERTAPDQSRQAKPSPNKMYDSPAKVDPKNNYNSQGRSERNQSVRNAIKSFFTPDGRRDPRLSSSKSQASKFLTMGVNDQNPGLKNYTGEGPTVENMKNKSTSTSTSTSAPKTNFAGRTPYTVENGKGKIHGPKDSYAKAYEKRDMKVYGNMSQAEFTKEAKRQTKSFKTTGKFDAPKKARKKVTKVTSLKPEGVDNKKMSIENIAAPGIKAEKLVAKAPKTAKQTRKSNSIDKKLAKAKTARASGNIKRAERKERRAINKEARNAGVRGTMRKSDRKIKKMNKDLDKLDKKSEKLLKENTK